MFFFSADHDKLPAYTWESDAKDAKQQQQQLAQNVSGKMSKL